MQNSALVVMNAQTTFLKTVREEGDSPDNKLVAGESLTTEGLVKFTKTVEGMVQGHYQKRSECQSLTKSLRVEEIELVTISFNTIYIDTTKEVSLDAKRTDKVTKIMESRAQDQHLLMETLGSLLNKHIPTLKERIEGRDSTQVTLNDLDDKGFTVGCLPPPRSHGVILSFDTKLQTIPDLAPF